MNYLQFSSIHFQVADCLVVSCEFGLGLLFCKRVAQSGHMGLCVGTTGAELQLCGEGFVGLCGVLRG